MSLVRGIRMFPMLLVWTPSKYLFAVFFGVDIACLLSRTDQWRGDWSSTIDWLGGSLILLGPIVAGVAAWRGVSSKVGLGEPADIGGIAWRANATEVLTTAGWAAIAHAVTLCVAVVVGLRAHTPGVPGLLPLLPQFGLILAYAAIGGVLGNLVPNQLVAPLVTVTLLYLNTQMSPGSRSELWVRVGGATSSLAGFRYNPQVLLAQTGLGVALFLVVLGVRRTVMGRLELRPTVLFAGVLPLLVLAGWLRTGPHQYLATAEGPRLTCVGSAPAVCALPARTDLAKTLQTIWAAEESAARRAGATSLPQRFDQVVADRVADASARGFVLEGTLDSAGRVDVLPATFYFEVDRSCLLAKHAPPGGPVSRLQVLAEYLLVKSNITTAREVGDPVLDRTLKASPSDRNAWVVASLEAASGCDFENVPALPVRR